MSCSLIQGDWIERLREMADESVNCVVTSPPYFGLRDYGIDGQLGLESTMDEYLERMVVGFREVYRVLRSDGTLWLNLGDSYATGTTSDRGPTAPGKHGYWENPAVNKRIDGRDLGLKPKDLMGIPWRVAFALQADGWYLRSDIIWAKPNPMPESVTDRPTKAHEYLFLMSKSERYFYDADAIKELCLTGDNGSSFTSERDFATKPNLGTGPRTKTVRRDGINRGDDPRGRKIKCKETPRNDGDRWNENNGRGFNISEFRNRRSVWAVATNAFPEAHFATFPPKLVEPCILAGCPQDGTVLDPFSGAGTTGLVATRLGRNFIGIELNPAYIEMSRRRIEQDAPLFNLVEASNSAEVL
jgi:DNA modification methylase